MNFTQGLQSPRLQLRPLCLDDADALFSMMSDPQVMRYWNTPPWTEHGTSRARHPPGHGGIRQGGISDLGHHPPP